MSLPSSLKLTPFTILHDLGSIPFRSGSIYLFDCFPLPCMWVVEWVATKYTGLPCIQVQLLFHFNRGKNVGNTRAIASILCLINLNHGFALHFGFRLADWLTDWQTNSIVNGETKESEFFVCCCWHLSKQASANWAFYCGHKLLVNVRSSPVTIHPSIRFYSGKSDQVSLTSTRLFLCIRQINFSHGCSQLIIKRMLIDLHVEVDVIVIGMATTKRWWV